MTTTTNLAMSLVQQNQAQKEVTVNEALTLLDAILNRGAVSLGDETPPGSPGNGDVYVLGASPTGDWATHGTDIAWYQGTWRFIAPNEGMTLWVNDENKYYHWDGSAWDDALDGISHVGVNATADATNKLSVNSAAILFNHNGDDVQIKVNKNATGDTASYLFQTGFSGRAEFGLIGDDDFQLKVSPDGSGFVQSFVVDKTTGDIDFKQDVTFTGELASTLQCADNLITRPELKDYAETAVSANSTTSYTIDLVNGNMFEITLTGNCTFTFSNPPATGKGGSFTLILKQDGTGSRTTTWPASVDWASGSAPTLTTDANAVDILTFLTIDAGTRWYGFLSGADMG